jgi:hypothetical protein
MLFSSSPISFRISCQHFSPSLALLSKNPNSDSDTDIPTVASTVQYSPFASSTTNWGKRFSDLPSSRINLFGRRGESYVFVAFLLARSPYDPPHFRFSFSLNIKKESPLDLFICASIYIYWDLYGHVSSCSRIYSMYVRNTILHLKYGGGGGESFSCLL